MIVCLMELHVQQFLLCPAAIGTSSQKQHWEVEVGNRNGKTQESYRTTDGRDKAFNVSQFKRMDNNPLCVQCKHVF